MPLDKPSLQLDLFEIPDLEEEPAGPDALANSDKAQNELMKQVLLSVVNIEEAANRNGAPVWASSFLRLLNQGWGWRKAAYIAWAATPKKERWPETQEMLATEVLGLSSDRVVSKWKGNNPAIEQAVAALQTYELFSYRGEVLDALKKSAANEDYKHHQDRKLFLEMIGDYMPQAQLRQLLMSGKMRLSKEAKDYSDEELAAIMRVTGMEAGELLMLGLGEELDEMGNSTAEVVDGNGSADE